MAANLAVVSFSKDGRDELARDDDAPWGRGHHPLALLGRYANCSLSEVSDVYLVLGHVVPRVNRRFVFEEICDLLTNGIVELAWLESLLGDIDGGYRDARVSAEFRFADADALIAAEEVGNDIVSTRNITHVRVHFLHLQLKAVECLGVDEGQGHKWLVVCQEPETSANQVVVEIVHAEDRGAHLQ